MMTGEITFDDLFFSAGHKPLIVTWGLFLLFLILMVIVLMNLLVGLAVDDISTVQQEAEFTTSKMKVDVCLQSEKILPKILRYKFISHDIDIYPNRSKGVPLQFRRNGNIKQIINILQQEQEPIDALQENVEKIQDGMKGLDEMVKDVAEIHVQLDEMKAMMHELMNRRT